jgi:hypothetical protein
MLFEMKKAMEKDRQKIDFLEMEMAEKTNREKEMAEMANRLEKEMVEKTNREKEMAEKTNRLEKKMSGLAVKTNRLEREMEEERNKSSRLEQEIKNEQKLRSMLELDVDDLHQSTHDISSWIVAGVCYIFFCLFFYSPIFSVCLKTAVNPSDEFRFVIFWIAFKLGWLGTFASPKTPIHELDQHFGGINLLD